MSTVIDLPAAGYRFIKGVFQYSSGVAALPGFKLVRARFHRPVELNEGFGLVESHLVRLGRPLAALCAFEIRSPAPFTETEFESFNRLYVGTLERWGLVCDGVNPVARTNVCPELAKPPGPSVYAFTYSIPDEGRGADSFVVAGSGEAPEGMGNYRDFAVRFGDTSSEGLREKAQWVLGEMERRMRLLGFGWADATATDLYCVHNVHPFLDLEIAARGAMAAGLDWHFARPPVQGLEYEMDVRRILQEQVIA